MATNMHRRRILMLNMQSLSATKVAEKDEVPLHEGIELLKIVDNLRKVNKGIEFFGMSIKEDMDELEDKKEHDSIRLIDMKFEPGDKFIYAVMLLEFIDADVRKMSVVHRTTRIGRDIEGEQEESAGYTSHVVVALPNHGTYDDRNYRCCVEYSSIITRRFIEAFLCRQLRRLAREADWSFSVITQMGDRKPKKKICRYWPKLELNAKVGRSIGVSIGGQELTHMIFSKRAEKIQVAQETSVIQKDVFGEVTYKISMKQGPEDILSKRGWIESLRESYEMRGFKTKMYFKTRGGDILSGTIDNDADAATDILMCPNQIIEVAEKPLLWRDTLDQDIVGKIRSLLDQDELWERPV